MTAFPRSLFGRLALLMVAVTALGFAAALLIFRYDRASLTERNFSDTKIVQIETLRAALASMQSQERPGFLRRLGQEYGVQLIPVADRSVIGRAAQGPRMLELQERLRARLGEDTEVRLQWSSGRDGSGQQGASGRPDGSGQQGASGRPEGSGQQGASGRPEGSGQQGASGRPEGSRTKGSSERRDESGQWSSERRDGPVVWIKLNAGDAAWWAGFTLPRAGAELPSRVMIWSGIVLVMLLIGAYLFALRMNRPLAQLQGAVNALGKGQRPPPLPESGPTEIAALAKGFNRMTSNLKQMEDDRALLLAGVSHDLRTPLSRLRLVAEMGVQDTGMKQGMVDDIEEMDRIITQFLDFARGEDKEPLAMRSVNAVVDECVERYRRKGHEITFEPAADLPLMPLREQSLGRALVNLIDNAYRYGSPAVDVTTRRDERKARIEVADRGPGIPPSEVERLKQPFTRLDTARGSAAGGQLGSGLGLAIVDRVIALHGGEFDLLLRDGGGTVARVTIPLPKSTDS